LLRWSEVAGVGWVCWCQVDWLRLGAVAEFEWGW
jgi:hypothetical protein